MNTHDLTTADLMHLLIGRMKHRYTTVRPALRQELLELLEDDAMHAVTSGGTRSAEANPFVPTGTTDGAA
jgi:hypothetical protein